MTGSHPGAERPAPAAGRGRCVVVVLDSLGVGALSDAEAYGDAGCDTLGHICAHRRLELPHLSALGLGSIRPLEGVPARPSPRASYGRMVERSAGKDSTTGHWELAGLVLEQGFRTYPEGFPAALIQAFEARAGTAVLGNVAASGTEIIRRLGARHRASGRPIVYTSSDPVLQIAAHEEVIPVERLYQLCRIAFELATPYGINRVIARPFTGPDPDYVRTSRRYDFTLPPPAPTVLHALQQAGVPVVAIGKIEQLFAGQGIDRAIKTENDREGVARTLEAIAATPCGLIFTNLVDFDMLYGHRRDVEGYARALEAFDRELPSLLAALAGGDLLILTSDHGNDPTFRGTDHTREHALLLAYARGGAGRDLGTRASFADVAATIADHFSVPWSTGTSFLDDVRAER